MRKFAGVNALKRHTNFDQSRECIGLLIPVMDKELTTFNTKLKAIEESGDT